MGVGLRLISGIQGWLSEAADATGGTGLPLACGGDRQGNQGMACAGTPRPVTTSPRPHADSYMLLHSCWRFTFLN
jgi:hypothetical protein